MSLYGDIKDLREKRAKLVTDAGAILTTAGEEKRDLTNEESERWEKLHADADSIKTNVDRLEKQLRSDEDLEGSVVERRSGVEDTTSQTSESAGQSDAEQRKARYSSAFNSWVRRGMSEISREDRDIMREGILPLSDEMRNAIPSELRAQGVATAGAGGATVPEGFQQELEVAQLPFSGMLQSARVIDTASGNDLPWPTTDDTSNKGALLAENTQDTEQDVTFGATTIQAYMYTSKIVRVSLQLMQDSAFNIEQELSQLLGERLGRILNEHATTGTGSAQPNGVVTAATVGKTAASATAITHDELLDLKHSVNSAYRASTSARWMFNDSTLLAIKQLKDSQNRPLWQAGIAVGEPDRIDGTTYVVNDDMASIATGNKTVLYGDFSKYVIRRVTPVQILRLAERYADFLQVGFLAFQRFDSDLINAGTGPIKVLQQL